MPNHNIVNMKRTGFISILLLLSFYTQAQLKVQLSPNVSIGISKNVETYFIVEKLAVERIDNFVFDIKGTDYSHQPMVYFAYKNFQRYKDDPSVVRMAAILQQVRDAFHDNGPVMEYLLNQKEFPAAGARFINTKIKVNNQPNDILQALLAELTDSLRKFYTTAAVADFFKANNQFYKGALNEAIKDINKSSFGYMEKWFGQKFLEYQLYISPGMPITPGEDSYRGFGPQILSSKGKIPSMIVSSSKMLPLHKNLLQYRKFGFDNQPVTKFIFSHEILHSFVNPLLDKYASQIKADSLLYTKNLKELLSPHYIGDWNVCVIEHLVRLGEIRVAVSMNDSAEAERLRKIHIGEYNCVLIPLLEQKIKEYEGDRTSYPTFESYLPGLIFYLHTLTPQIIDDQVVKYKDYGKK